MPELTTLDDIGICSNCGDDMDFCDDCGMYFCPNCDIECECGNLGEAL